MALSTPFRSLATLRRVVATATAPSPWCGAGSVRWGSGSSGATPSTVLVVGGAGGLGRAVVDVFAAHGWSTVSADVVPNTNADRYVSLVSTGDTDLRAQASGVVDSLATGVDAVVCTAGGWAGGSIDDPAVFDAVERMHDVCVRPAVLAAHVAAHSLRASGGLLVFCGAAAALHPTPDMIGYGLAKAATHHLVASLAAASSFGSATVTAVLPSVIDTPMNREGMPDADHSSWTPPTDIAEQLVKWTAAPPTSGSMYVASTSSGHTEFQRV